MSGYDYNQYNVGLANMLVVSTTDVNYQTVLPFIIGDAEQRCYRDLDLLNTVVRDTTGAFTPGNRDFNLPAANGTFEVVDSIYAITPAGATTGNGSRVDLVPASRQFINILYPSSTGSGVPQY